MDWFKRYGIPGTYFLTMAGLWAYAFGAKEIAGRLTGPGIVAIIALLSLPVGFIISMLGLWEYEVGGGFEAQAQEKTENGAQQEDEKKKYGGRGPALSVIHTLQNVLADETDKQGGLLLKLILHNQEWIRKRNDVIAICHSIEWATAIAPLAGPVVAYVALDKACLTCWPVVPAIIVFLVWCIIVNIPWDKWSGQKSRETKYRGAMMPWITGFVQILLFVFGAGAWFFKDFACYRALWEVMECQGVKCLYWSLLGISVVSFIIVKFAHVPYEKGIAQVLKGERAYMQVKKTERWCRDVYG